MQNKGLLQLPQLPGYATNNGHIFYMICKTPDERDALIAYLQQNGILAIFHYLPLHKSAFYASKYKGSSLPMAQKYADQLVRLPLFYTLTENEQLYIIDKVNAFYAYK